MNLLADDIFGEVTQPNSLPSSLSTPEDAIGKIVGLGVRVLIVFAGLYAVINLILAGYAFLSAGDDPKKVAGAWTKIWQTLLGLAVAAGAFVLAAIFGQLLFGKPEFLLQPTIPQLQ